MFSYSNAFFGNNDVELDVDVMKVVHLLIQWVRLSVLEVLLLFHAARKPEQLRLSALLSSDRSSFSPLILT